MMKIVIKSSIIFLSIIFPNLMFGQFDYDTSIDKVFKETLLLHKELVSIPNLPQNEKTMLKNIFWVENQYKNLGFETTLLETSTLPILLTEKMYDPQLKTVLFYFHIDGQPVNPDAWDQEDPFVPVLKSQDQSGKWNEIKWESLENTIDDEWRIFARAAADDKAPITMFFTALKLMQANNTVPKFNIKVMFDPEEEYGSHALLSTLEKYKSKYTSDYFIVMDGPAHDSNKPTLTFGCRGIATCSITTYGAKLPQHSGHFGNYAPNPVFRLASLLASMKDEHGKVTIEDYYEGISIDDEVKELLNAVPYDKVSFDHKLGIHSCDHVAESYQEALQYPSLNVRQIGTSWEGKKLKTVIPEYAVAHLDVRLVPEVDGEEQLSRIKKHIVNEGFYLIDREPTEKERLAHPRIAKFVMSRSIKAFRTSPEMEFGKKLRSSLKSDFGEDPIVIRMMGGTVPIVPLINGLNVPTVIVPMVNMDNNQHSPNENIRIGNIRDGIKSCLSILNTEM